MSKAVEGIGNAVEVLAKIDGAWPSVNRFQNQMWNTRFSCFGSNCYHVPAARQYNGDHAGG